jgi:hypothetical protein
MTLKSKVTLLALMPATIFLVGCSGPKIVKMDRDTYFIQKRSAQVGFGPPMAAKAEIYKIANEFCEKRGMQLETVDFSMVDSAFARPGSVALEFRCVPKNEER